MAENKDKKDVRTLQLTHEEIEHIILALQYVYDQKLEVIRNNRKLISEVHRPIVDSANKYFNLNKEIESGKKDV